MKLIAPLLSSLFAASALVIACSDGGTPQPLPQPKGAQDASDPEQEPAVADGGGSVKDAAAPVDVCAVTVPAADTTKGVGCHWPFGAKRKTGAVCAVGERCCAYNKKPMVNECVAAGTECPAPTGGAKLTEYQCAANDDCIGVDGGADEVCCLVGTAKADRDCSSLAFSSKHEGTRCRTRCEDKETQLCTAGGTECNADEVCAASKLGNRDPKLAIQVGLCITK